MLACVICVDLIDHLVWQRRAGTGSLRSGGYYAKKKQRIIYVHSSAEEIVRAIKDDRELQMTG
jgi:hypothetical protein